MHRSAPRAGGYGRRGGSTARAELDRVLAMGRDRWSSATGSALRMTSRTESRRRLPGADPAAVSERARERGRSSSARSARATTSSRSSWSSDLDPPPAHAFGLRRGPGHRAHPHRLARSRPSGLHGLRARDGRARRYDIALPDRQLACAPLSSPEGQATSPRCAPPRTSPGPTGTCMAHRVREAFAAVIGERDRGGHRQVYDVAHNMAKLESTTGGRSASTARGPRARSRRLRDIPPATACSGSPSSSRGAWGRHLRPRGQPGAMEHSFGTICHGAGRR